MPEPVPPRPVSGVLDSTPDAGPTERWHPVTRFIVRATLLYSLTVWAPLTIFTTSGAGWWNAVATSVGSWAIVSLGLPPRSAPSEQIATLLPPIVASAVLGVASLVLAAVWTLADRRRLAYPRLLAWLHTAVRFLLGGALVFYGALKLLPAQFGLGVLPDTLVRPFGTLHPQELLWGFMAASRPYTILSGFIELVAGLLLFSRRTATLGALVAIVATTQVLALNVAYDVIVKLFAAQLLLMAIFVAAPDLPGLARLLVSRRAATPRRLGPLFLRAALDRAARVAGIVIAFGWTLWAFNVAQSQVQRRQANRVAPLYGIWERQALDGSWRYLVVPWNGLVVFVSEKGVERYVSRVDARAGTLALNSRAAGSRTRAIRFSQPDPATLLLSESGVEIALTRVEESEFALNRHRYRWTW
jgi:hypothetical protein